MASDSVCVYFGIKKLCFICNDILFENNCECDSRSVECQGLRSGNMKRRLVLVHIRDIDELSEYAIRRN